MIALDDLRTLGALPRTLRVVDLPEDNYIFYSELKNLSETDQAAFDGFVVLDNPAWLATVRGVTPSGASSVYSHNGEDFGKWKKSTRTFSHCKLVGGKLNTISEYTLPDLKVNENPKQEKENTLMNFDTFEGLDVNAQTMNSFDLGGEKKSAGATKAEQTRAEKQKIIDAIDEQTGNITIANKDEITLFNKQHGRLFGFITPNNAVVKVAKKSVNRLDANGKKILAADAPEDVRAKFNETGKCASKYLDKEDAIKFVHTKPSKPIGVVIGTPAGGDVAISDIVNKTGDVHKDGDDKNLVMHILNYDMAFTYIAALYDNNIKESEEVLGERAGWVTNEVTTTTVVPKDGTGEGTPKYRCTLKHDRQLRKTLIAEGNYFPLKVYKTVPYQALSEANAQMLNYNFEAMLARNANAFDKLCKADKEKITKDPNGHVTSAYFKTGASFDESVVGSQIQRYDAADEVLQAIELPVREAKPAKSSDKGMTYSFSFAKLEDADGPMSVPQYAKFFKATKMSEAEFKEQISKLGKKRAKGTSKVTISADQFLRAVASPGNLVENRHEIKDIDAAVKGLMM